MDIEVQEVTYKDVKHLVALAPVSILNRIKDIGTHTVAAHYTDSGKKVYIGLLQLRIEADTAVLEWLYVTESHRRSGTAKQLLDVFWEIKNKSKASKARTLLYGKYVNKSDKENLTALLLENGFESCKEVQGPFLFNVKELLLQRSPIKTDELQIVKKGIVPFSEMTPDEISQGALALRIDSHILLRADRKLSFMYKQGALCKGTVMIIKRGHTYYFQKLVAEDKKAEEKLVTFLVYSVDKKLRLSDDIVIEYNDRSSFWMEKLLPEIKSQAAILLTT